MSKNCSHGLWITPYSILKVRALSTGDMSVLPWKFHSIVILNIFFFFHFKKYIDVIFSSIDTLWQCFSKKKMRLTLMLSIMKGLCHMQLDFLYGAIENCSSIFTKRP